jgi:DNA-binding NtrC family response regulator
MVGAGGRQLTGTVRRLLRGLGLRSGPRRSREQRPDLVLVAVERGQVDRRLAAARDRARGAPVVAVLRSSDVELAGDALAAGAHAFHALDTSLEYLRATVLILLGLNAARDRRVATSRPGSSRATRSLLREADASPAPA